MPGSGPDADDDLCQDFVKNLATLRGKLGWSQERLAAEAHVSKGTVAMTESFQRKPHIDHGRCYDKAFGLSGVFEAKARDIQDGAFPVTYRDFPVQEALAHDICVYEHSVFPGLLQTERYARAVLSAWPSIRPEEVERRVTGRLNRQDVLHREEPAPPRLWALVDEAALRRPVAEPEVMYEQCMHTLQMTQLWNVSLAVVPHAARWHVGLLGACTIVERDGIPRAMYLDDFVDGGVQEDPARVAQAAQRFRAILHLALPGGASQDMIERLAKELWKA